MRNILQIRFSTKYYHTVTNSHVQEIWWRNSLSLIEATVENIQSGSFANDIKSGATIDFTITYTTFWIDRKLWRHLRMMLRWYRSEHVAVATRRARMYVICCSWRIQVTGDIKDRENLDLTRIDVMPFHPSSAHKLPFPLPHSAGFIHSKSHITYESTIYFQKQSINPI